MLKWLVGCLAAVAITAVGAAAWYATRPASYDECVVSEMRGQSAAAMPAVQRMCAVRFRKEEELPLYYMSSGKLDFLMLPDFDKDPTFVLRGSARFEKPPFVFRVSKNETDYEITRVWLRHSFEMMVDCNGLKDSDWKDGPELIFADGVASVALPSVFDAEVKLHRPPFCFHYARIWGVPRKQ